MNSRAATQVLDAGWRAAAYCLHPRVIGWSLLPLALAVAVSFGMAWFFWEPAVTAVRAQMESWLIVDTLLKWLDVFGLSGLRSVLAPLLVVALALPLIMALSLLLVAALMTPSLTRLVAERRFPTLARREGGSLVGGLAWSLGSTALALLVLLLTMPFWLIPPVALVVPPLIWGWLSYRVFCYDVLAEHASADERRALLRQHRWPLLAIGVVSGYLGAAPTLIFAFGAMSLVLAPLLLPIAIWLYMLVFALAALWFAHYALAALQQLRSQGSVIDGTVTPAPIDQALPPL
ncbi:EI24 domain-containing protein [Inhella crocodyli]|uniref:EI24 domain-containing protein n=1 Tax=Inhella crocodyli TaxID=2499851 RepID=A0A437LSP2_9BURK|nr:EI24 domain-containing protein [Inhella crocodyli]RVT88410.1 EI24 domain-containing protein [Inhella crocodyli]